MLHAIRLPVRTLLALVLVLGVALVAGLDAPGKPGGRVVVLGFDGADAGTVERLMDAGALPNLSKLRQQGCFAPLGTTVPAESPVAWASLNSGQNPAKTGVSGFVNREFRSDGSPKAAIGFYSNATRRTEDMQLAFWQRFLVQRSPASAAAILGVASALFFALVLLLLLRLPRGLSLGLALLLGALGAWGGWSASRALPRSIEEVWVNATKVGGFWETAARAGVPSLVIDGAMAWDRPEIPGAKVLAGLGVPDARGDYGSWCRYTTEDEKQAFLGPPNLRGTQSGGRVFRIEEREGRVETFLYGPWDDLRRERLETELAGIEAELAGSGLSTDRERELERLQRERAAELKDMRDTRGGGKSDEYRLVVPLTLTRVPGGKLEVRIGEELQTLAEGQWSDWFHPRFDASPLFQVHTLTRVKLRKLQDPLDLIVDFLHFDPSRPAFYQPISQPPAFAGELARAIGGYETVGWACLTHGLKDGDLDPRTFLEDIQFTHECRRKLLLAALQREDWRLLVDVESTPDRVQHMCYQYADPTHPLYDAQAAATPIRLFGEPITYAGAIDASYRSMDRLVGDVLARLRSDDVLLVCSDHGFQSFRRQCHLNNWLAEHGYLKLKEGLTAADADYFPDFIDWSGTQAYALGLGMIFVNLAGREPQGIVKPEEVPALVELITKDLLATEDEGHRAVHSVTRLAQVHSGPYLGLEAELMVGFAAGWRVSWVTTSGALKFDEETAKAAPAFSDNRKNWSGDHVSVSRELVRGILFSNRKLTLPEAGPDLLDVAPTALQLLGVPTPAEYDRSALSVIR